MVGRPRNTDTRRAQIADGLVAALARHGATQTTTADIAREAGVTPGLVHYHFPSKQAVLLYAVERIAESVYQRFQEKSAHATSARGRLGAFVDAYVGLGPGADANAVACWVAVAAEAVRDGEVRAVYQAASERAFEELVTLVKDAFAEAGSDSAGARPLAATLWCAIQGSYQVATAAPRLLPRGTMSTSLQSMINGALVPERKRA